MNVLVCCEESQRVTLAFRARGFNAFSCDIQTCSGGAPEYHIRADCLLVLAAPCTFSTCDNKIHYVDKWDLVIAHPPCTFLSNAGHCRLVSSDGSVNLKRYELGLLARQFFMRFIQCEAEHIAVENPIPMKIFNLPKYDQIIQPFYFGDPYYKTTCLWLRGLPHLSPTNICDNPIPTTRASWWNDGSRSERQKNRSKTFPGIASAMAVQWGDYLLYGEHQLSFFLPRTHCE